MPCKNYVEHDKRNYISIILKSNTTKMIYKNSLHSFSGVVVDFRGRKCFRSRLKKWNRFYLPGAHIYMHIDIAWHWPMCRAKRRRYIQQKYAIYHPAYSTHTIACQNDDHTTNTLKWIVWGFFVFVCVFALSLSLSCPFSFSLLSCSLCSSSLLSEREREGEAERILWNPDIWWKFDTHKIQMRSALAIHAKHVNVQVLCVH